MEAGGRWKKGGGKMANAEWPNGRRHRGAGFLENRAARSPGRAPPLQTTVNRCPGDAPDVQKTVDCGPGRAPTLQTTVNRSPGDAPDVQKTVDCGPGRAPRLQTTVNRSPGDAPDVQKTVDCGPADARPACGGASGSHHQRRHFQAGGADACTREGRMQKNHLRAHCPGLEGRF
jgi:hypothetical protein